MKSNEIPFRWQNITGILIFKNDNIPVHMKFYSIDNN